MDLIALAVPFFVLALLLELLVDRIRHSGHFRTSDALNSLSAGVLSTTTGYFTRLVAAAIWAYVLQDLSLFDGGDVLVLGKKIFVGLSTRSNQAAVDQLNELLWEYGYSATGVHLHDCLHLKSAVTRLDEHTLLINKNWVDTAHFIEYRLIEVDPSEPFAANCLPLGGRILFPTAFPKSRARLEEAGYQVATVDVSELAKAEGAVTCCSLILP
jgi:N-dimethylarginine dimethylaminohydrolase